MAELLVHVGGDGFARRADDRQLKRNFFRWLVTDRPQNLIADGDADADEVQLEECRVAIGKAETP